MKDTVEPETEHTAPAEASIVKVTALPEAPPLALAVYVVPPTVAAAGVRDLESRGEPDERCKSCAGTYGTVPNGCLQTQLDLTKCIVDRGCTIPDGLVVGEDPQADAERFNRTERGVTLITRDMLARLG